jgi:hypothetical protein
MSNASPGARVERKMPAGALPNLLIAGVPKAGTTSLFRYLKGIRYFKPLLSQDGQLEDPDSYREYFSHWRGERYLMEATPSYCYGRAPLLKAIRDTLDHPHTIISLRDPIDRLWSAYTFQRTRGHMIDIESFEEYVSISELRSDVVEPGSHLNGIYISLYASYLEDWFEFFGDDVRIVFAEHLFSDPSAVVRDICTWLGIDAEITASFDYAVHNKTEHAKSLRVSRAARTLKRMGRPLLEHSSFLKEGLRRVYTRVNTGELEETMSPQVRRRLEDRFRSSNRAVAAMLAARGYENLPSWLESELPHSSQR